MNNTDQKKEILSEKEWMLLSQSEKQNYMDNMLAMRAHEIALRVFPDQTGARQIYDMKMERQAFALAMQAMRLRARALFYANRRIAEASFDEKFDIIRATESVLEEMQAIIDGLKHPLL